MKLSEYEDYQQDALKEYFLQKIGFYKQEEMMFQQSVYRMLILANGSAIFLLSAFLGALVSGGKSTDGFAFPLFLFFVGLVSGGYTIQYGVGVAHTAVTKISEQVLQVFENKLDIFDFQSWGFSPKGLIVIGVAQLVSTASFLLGVIVVLFRI